MSPLTPEEMDDLRREMASLAIPDANKDELIHIIDNIVISFVDQAHGLDPVQLSLAARANKHFKNGSPCGNGEETKRRNFELNESIIESNNSKRDLEVEP